MVQKKIFLMAMVGLMMGVISANAATYYIVENGDWSNYDIWSPYGVIPGASDVVCVSGAWELTIDGQQYANTVYPGYGWNDNYGSMTISDPTASLTATNMWVAGNFSDGTNMGWFTQWAGTITLTGSLGIKTMNGTTVNSTYPNNTAWGKYDLYDGTLNVAVRTYVGYPGKGMFNQYGGTHTVPWLMLGYKNSETLGVTSDVAYYTMTGGTLAVRDDISIGVNNSGRGEFDLGNATSTGTINGTANLRCRANYTAGMGNGVGIFQGWGTVGLTGKIYNNDKVIANSWSDETTQADRDLDLSSMAGVQPIIATWPLTTGEGWYATNRGRLILPAITVAAGTSTVNWGEGVSATTLSLVNSVAMVFTDVTGGKVSVALNAKDRSDVGLADQNVIGVWAFDGSAFDFGSGSASLTFKYDDAAAATLGLAEANLKVYAKVAGNWTEVTAMIDTAAHQLTIANQTTFTTIAIGEIAAQQVQGDANGDGKVDVSDLGILAANYGMTSGATLAQGDFNGDGAVDVSDLGILAANYGTGTQAGADFNADYAKVFGAASEENAAEDTTSSACSSLGLSLIAGLAMLGLMLVKLED